METRRQFRGLLREIFQFNSAELDFGIYRIMNHKRAAIENFIENDLEAAVQDGLKKGLRQARTSFEEDLENARNNLLETLGEDALTADGELAPEHLKRPITITYQNARRRAGKLPTEEEMQQAAFNHLHTFFSRYYEDGDFISKRRYSARERYAIPYNGEEVHLHWANRDQYYIKTGENFARYQFRLGQYSVRFTLQNADTEQDNRKGDKRFFFPLAKQATCDGNAITIPFDYRPFKTGEKARVGGGNGLQEKILQKALPHFEKTLPVAGDALLPHMRRYACRNTSDYFIHKNLHGFLSRELDFYIKNEVLSLDDLENAGEFAAEGRFHLLRVIRTVGGRIIEFLAQIENFQKRLFEKKKFVTQTHWCAAVGQIQDEKLLAEIAACDAQWKEWRALLDMKATKAKRLDALRANPTLLVDTAHFGGEFRDKLLAQFEDIDGACDGVLIRGENFQGLNLLAEKYRGQVKCIYIDPPYNTDASAILYKNNYKHSSWLSLVENRLEKAKGLMPVNGVLCCAIDDEEVWRLRNLLQLLFERELGIVPVRSTPAGRKSSEKFSPSHEYALFYGNSKAMPGVLAKTQKELDRYPFFDEIGRFAWNNLIRHGSNDRREDRPKMFYPIYIDSNNSMRIPKLNWNEDQRQYKILEAPKTDEVAVWPTRETDSVKLEKNWHHGWERVMQAPGEYRVRRDTSDGISIDFKIRMDESAMPKTWWDDGKYSSANHGTKALKNILPNAPFDFPKSIELVKDCLLASGANNSAASILDFFAGSGTTGHAIINLNREDGGQRKFILIEMGDHFDNVLLPRIKKITYAPEWKDGKPRRAATPEEAARSPRLLKYQRLESYEDALENIQFKDDNSTQAAMKFPDYLLRYMLDWETRQSPSLLNPAQLSTPFDYKLRIRRNGNFQETPVDLPETFNYLIGLQTQTRRTLQNGPHTYQIYTGLSEGHQTTIIWRTTKDWTPTDFERDRDFLTTHALANNPTRIYTNSDSLLPHAQSLDPIFQTRLFAT
ncbi:MAG: site-specific DNA-methyltransferase [Deltaproteobacteria bacterium]|nr:site-specific DNA-methyltransferase [Deltaproteobacteria bacterium]